MNQVETDVAGQLGWQRDTTTLLFQSRWYRLRQDQLTLPNGEPATYTYMEHPGVVGVVPVTPAGEIVLIRIFRYPVNDWCWAIPGGGVGDKPGLSTADVARDELLEEIGGVAGWLQDLGAFPLAAGVARLPVHYFLAHDVHLEAVPNREATEVIAAVQTFTVEQALDLIYEEQAMEIESAFGVQLALRHLQDAQEDWRPRKPR